jgi:hypothetical protein
MRRCFSLHVMLVAVLVLAADSDGAMITISVQGELTSVVDEGPYLAPSIVPGAPFEASFSLESVGPDGQDLDPNLGTYGGGFGPWGSDATVGDYSFSGTFARLSVHDDRNVRFEGSLVTGDAMFLDFDFVVFPGIPCVTNFTIIIVGKCHSFTLSFIDPTSDLFTSDAFPAAFPDLEEWGSVTLTMGMASGGAPGFGVTGTVNALTVVPEPSSGFLLACSLVALAKGRRRTQLPD